MGMENKVGMAFDLLTRMMLPFVLPRPIPSMLTPLLIPEMLKMTVHLGDFSGVLIS
jgi:hypothetical protein